ncbi:MAG: 4-hydroxy-tetrahydrodipicolinate reductase [Lentisphaeria bacterium]|jgi:4-hydroxy-tetrahydrodipicolinate reductase
MLRIAILGAAGRMGRMLVANTLKDPELQLAGAVETPESPFIGIDAAAVAGLPACGTPVSGDLEAALRHADAVIDFTAPAAVLGHARAAAAAGCAIVIGTTGLPDADKAALAELAQSARIVFTPNMSVGVNVLFHLCDQVARLLGPEYDIEVVEMHHNLKKDAPSGTAERMGEILARASGLDYKADTRHGRFGLVGPRGKREIGMHAVRGGDVVGDHTAIFATQGERLELTHKASGRETFAKGALRAAKFLATAQPGQLYDMQDVLGLR